MNEKLRVVGIQANLVWEDKESNLKQFEQLISAAPVADLYVLPEMFSTGFSMQTEKLAEPMNGKTHLWMKELAKGKNAVIAGSLIIEDNGAFYNRLLWVEPSGNTVFYDKRHCFTMAGEHKHYSRGKKNVVVNLKGWRIALQVCYDLRFPVWSRNKKHYDVLLYVANWPEVRKTAWCKLLEARAIENQCFVVGVNRVGLDKNQINHSGNSALIDPFGNPIVSTPENEEAVFYGEIDPKVLEHYRQKFPVLNDADEFEVKP